MFAVSIFSRDESTSVIAHCYCRKALVRTAVAAIGQRLPTPTRAIGTEAPADDVLSRWLWPIRDEAHRCGEHRSARMTIHVFPCCSAQAATPVIARQPTNTHQQYSKAYLGSIQTADTYRYPTSQYGLDRAPSVGLARCSPERFPEATVLGRAQACQGHLNSSAGPAPGIKPTSPSAS